MFSSKCPHNAGYFQDLNNFFNDYYSMTAQLFTESLSFRIQEHVLVYNFLTMSVHNKFKKGINDLLENLKRYTDQARLVEVEEINIKYDAFLRNSSLETSQEIWKCGNFIESAREDIDGIPPIDFSCLFDSFSKRKKTLVMLTDYYLKVNKRLGKIRDAACPDYLSTVIDGRVRVQTIDLKKIGVNEGAAANIVMQIFNTLGAHGSGKVLNVEEGFSDKFTEAQQLIFKREAAEASHFSVGTSVEEDADKHEVSPKPTSVKKKKKDKNKSIKAGELSITVTGAGAVASDSDSEDDSNLKEDSGLKEDTHPVDMTLAISVAVKPKDDDYVIVEAANMGEEDDGIGGDIDIKGFSIEEKMGDEEEKEELSGIAFIRASVVQTDKVVLSDTAVVSEVDVMISKTNTADGIVVELDRGDISTVASVDLATSVEASFSAVPVNTVVELPASRVNEKAASVVRCKTTPDLQPLSHVFVPVYTSLYLVRSFNGSGLFSVPPMPVNIVDYSNILATLLYALPEMLSAEIDVEWDFFVTETRLIRVQKDKDMLKTYAGSIAHLLGGESLLISISIPNHVFTALNRKIMEDKFVDAGTILAHGLLYKVNQGKYHYWFDAQADKDPVYSHLKRIQDALKLYFNQNPSHALYGNFKQRCSVFTKTSYQYWEMLKTNNFDLSFDRHQKFINYYQRQSVHYAQRHLYLLQTIENLKAIELEIGL